MIGSIIVLLVFVMICVVIIVMLMHQNLVLFERNIRLIADSYNASNMLYSMARMTYMISSGRGVVIDDVEVTGMFSPVASIPDNVMQFTRFSIN